MTGYIDVVDIEKYKLMSTTILGRAHIETWTRSTIKMVESATSTLVTDVGDKIFWRQL